MFEEVALALSEYGTVIIHRHSRPDGDALGAQLGLAALIRDNFPGKKVFVVGDAAGRYTFMKGSVMDQVPDNAYEGALAFVLDCGASHLVSDERYKNAARTIRIDHHLYCETFTDVEIVDSSFESASGMIAQLAVECGWKITKDSAEAMFTGMVTDSGRFRFDSTSPRTLRLAATLLEQNVDTVSLYRELYSEDMEALKRKAVFISKIKKYKDSAVAYMIHTAEEIRALGMDAFSVSRGTVNIMADIWGIDVWVNFTEDDGKFLCEIRSAVKNINPIAVKYGGGGHKKASGCSVPDTETAFRLLEDLKVLTETDGE
jgi:phosphoesterase RecJ-like protein